MRTIVQNLIDEELKMSTSMTADIIPEARGIKAVRITFRKLENTAMK